MGTLVISEDPENAALFFMEKSTGLKSVKELTI